MNKLYRSKREKRRDMLTGLVATAIMLLAITIAISVTLHLL